jgi:hypothetical protein
VIFILRPCSLSTVGADEGGSTYPDSRASYRLGLTFKNPQITDL